MKKHILLIEFCNYENYPLGGHLSFAKHLLKAFGDELALVGITTDDETPVGCWVKKNIDGIEYDFYSVKRIFPSSQISFIPQRIKAYLSVKKHKNKILAYGIKNLIIQTPEIFFNFKDIRYLNICLILPGLGNPLIISRYVYGKFIAKIYENIFFKAIDSANVLLAAADSEAITDFIHQSKNRFDKNKLIQFPTRFDDLIFSKRDKIKAKSFLGIDINSILIITSGRLNYYKGWKFLIDSFSIFKKDEKKALLIFLGDGEDKHKIEDYLVEKEIGNNVLLKGNVDHITLSKYLNAADLFVMGSYAEGWSTSLVEAVASAIPICTTNFSSAKELVHNGTNGFVVDNRDEMLFAVKMHEALHLSQKNITQKASEIQILSISNLKNEFLKYWEIK